MGSYYDIDAILTDAQKVPCTFEIDVPGLGFIDGNAGADVSLTTKCLCLEQKLKNRPDQERSTGISTFVALRISRSAKLWRTDTLNRITTIACTTRPQCP